MKRILPLIVFCFFAVSAYANDIDGTWIGKVQGPDGEMELTFVFKVENGTLTGVVKSFGGDTPISNTKVNGKQFSFDVAFNGMAIKHDCTVQDQNTITMKVTGTPMGDSEMTLKRKA